MYIIPWRGLQTSMMRVAWLSGLLRPFKLHLCHGSWCHCCCCICSVALPTRCRPSPFYQAATCPLVQQLGRIRQLLAKCIIMAFVRGTWQHYAVKPYPGQIGMSPPTGPA